MNNLIEQAIESDDGAHAAKIIQHAARHPERRRGQLLLHVPSGNSNW